MSSRTMFSAKPKGGLNIPIPTSPMMTVFRAPIFATIHPAGIAKIIRDSPSLRRYSADVLDDEYRTARADAAGETGLPEDAFPEICPFTIEQILDPGFLPDDV